MPNNYCRQGFDTLHRIGVLHERLSPSREPEFHNRFQGILVQWVLSNAVIDLTSNYFVSQRARKFAEYFQVAIIGLNANATPGVAYQQAFARLQQELDIIEQEYEVCWLLSTR